MTPLVRLVAILIAGGAVLMLSSCYVTTQGYYLLQTQARATPISRLEERGAITAEERAFFDRVDEIRAFAGEELGLSASRNYRSYVATDRDHLADVVSAAGATSFARKEWGFPFFGRFPYKGFYRPEAARRLARRLDEAGWDVIVRPVGAFSTLGFFRDPLFSYMIDYGEARLVEMIIHEMAHATLWVSNEGQFNEEFATFVGRRGAERYLVGRYGTDSPQMEDFRESRADLEQFYADIARLRSLLEDLYTSETDVDRILAGKERIIEAFRAEFVADYDGNYRSDRYRFLEEQTINNAWIDLFTTYSGNIDRFEALYAMMGRDLPATIAEIRERVRLWEENPRRDRTPVVEILPAPSPSIAEFR